METRSDLVWVPAALLGAMLFVGPAAAQERSREKARPTASDPANPDSKPLKDKSKRANPDSKPVRDGSEKAGKDLRPVEDEEKNRSGDPKRTEEVEDRGDTAGDDARPLKDRKPSKAGDESRKVEDDGDDQANPKADSVEEEESRKASEPDEKVEDESRRANRRAGDVKDGEDDKANPAARRDAGKERVPPNRDRERQAEREGQSDEAEGEADKSVPPDREMPAEGDKAPAEPPLDTTPEAMEAEDAVRKATEEAEARIGRRKLEIRGESEARTLIDDILGKESTLSRAELDRDRRAGARRPAGRDADPARRVEGGANRAQLAEAARYLRQRLRGEVGLPEAPEFFRRPDLENEKGRREARPGDRREVGRERFVVPQPRYFHEGRRYVHFDSRESIPAILLATAALDRVRVQPAREVQPFFDGRRFEDAALPPEEYRGEGAWVVSYPVNEKSMVSSNDILFRQGSTQFADGHSYDMVLALSDALDDPSLAEARFVVEGHASAEGSYEDNMELSQRRAEAIVREMVRGGVSPDRLVPVGYGESEARHPADAPEALRSQDRRVVVFRMEDGPVAGR
jgi:outer membrane protein OmpA-like peptidoglycan-associated protein